ncbi:MAG: hypothetical protein DRO14_03065 [Thermoprotei archaeon]|nr:MAG: hypothetical protein DRO14_03065 [Thermoprotei archaeon]
MNSRVVKIEGKDSVEEVVLDSGERIRSNMVILAMGAKPNTDLAQKMGLKISEYGVELK